MFNDDKEADILVVYLQHLHQCNGHWCKCCKYITSISAFLWLFSILWIVWLLLVWSDANVMYNFCEIAFFLSSVVTRYSATSAFIGIYLMLVWLEIWYWIRSLFPCTSGVFNPDTESFSQIGHQKCTKSRITEEHIDCVLGSGPKPRRCTSLCWFQWLLLSGWPQCCLPPWMYVLHHRTL